ncbi:MAG: hypothetical protein B6U72_07660, partial [Candidatus Altiarchaeales archaeon ex4484_2]
MAYPLNRSEFWRFGIGSEGDEGTVTWNTMASGIDDMSGLVSVDDGLWHHLCASYDSGTGEKRIYVDGHLDASKTAHEGNPLGQNPRYGFIGVGSEAAEFDGAKGPNQYFKGVLDEFRIYGRALSEGEVADLYGIHAYIYGGCSEGGVRLGVSEFCCGVSDGLCVGDFGIFCHDPDCDVIGCPGGGVRLGGSDFCCGVSDGLCVEDFGVECVDPDCVFSGNGSCTLPVNPLSGSGSDSVDSSQDSSPISSPAMPFSPLDFLLMSTVAAALYVALSGNSESIKKSLSDIMSRSRGLDIQNMRVDPVIVDGVDVNYVNLDGVETEEVVLRNVKDLQFIDLSGLKADRVVLEDISVYGDINLRGAQIGELVVRNVDLGGDLIFNCDTSPGSPISSLTVEGVKSGGDVSLELDKVDSQVGNVLIRDVEAKGSIRAYLDIPEGFDAGNLTVEDVTAGGDVRASLEGEGEGYMGDLVCRNIKAVGKVSVDVRAEGKTAGEVFLESVTALGDVSLDVDSIEGGDVNDMLVTGIVSAGDLDVDVSSRDGSEVDGLRVEDVRVSRDLSIDLRSDESSDFRSVEISEGVVGGDFNLEVDVDDEADMSSVDVHDFSVGDTGDFYFDIDDGSRISGIDLSDLVFGKDFDLDVDLSDESSSGSVQIRRVDAVRDVDLSFYSVNESSLGASVSSISAGRDFDIDLLSEVTGSDYSISVLNAVFSGLSAGGFADFDVEADRYGFLDSEVNGFEVGGDARLRLFSDDVGDLRMDFEGFDVEGDAGIYFDSADGGEFGSFIDDWVVDGFLDMRLDACSGSEMGVDFNFSEVDGDFYLDRRDDGGSGSVYYGEYDVDVGGSFYDFNHLNPDLGGGDEEVVAPPSVVSEANPVVEDADDKLHYMLPGGGSGWMPWDDDMRDLFSKASGGLSVEDLTPKELCDILYGDSELNPWRDVEDDPYKIYEGVPSQDSGDSSTVGGSDFNPPVYLDDYGTLWVVDDKGNYQGFSYDRVKEQLDAGLGMSVDPTNLSPQTIFGILYKDHPEHNPYSNYESGLYGGSGLGYSVYDSFDYLQYTQLITLRWERVFWMCGLDTI